MTPGDERDSQGWGSGSVARRPSNDRAYRTSSFAANIGMVSRRPEHPGSRAVMMHRPPDWHAPGLTVCMARCGPGPLVCVAFQPAAALGNVSRFWTASALPAEAPDPQADGFLYSPHAQAGPALGCDVSFEFCCLQSRTGEGWGHLEGARPAA